MEEWLLLKASAPAAVYPVFSDPCLSVPLGPSPSSAAESGIFMSLGGYRYSSLGPACRLGGIDESQTLRACEAAQLRLLETSTASENCSLPRSPFSLPQSLRAPQ